uniref:Retrotransposon Copia-like N-terminal domain-containing protein n=1 Tax=Cannabis sativa TaxID=3483 RepID=A0A803P8Y1_CANSA
MARDGGTQARGRVHTCANRESENNSNDSYVFSILGENSRSTNANNFSNPYFLSNGDNPCIVLVPKILKDSGNYSTKRRAMLIALVPRNKIKFVNGKLPQPDKDHEDYDQGRSHSLYKSTSSNAREFAAVVQRFRSKYNCTHCGMNGHSIERCHKLNGYPPGHKLHDKFLNRDAKGPPGKPAGVNFSSTDEGKSEKRPLERNLVFSLSNV